MARPDPSKDNGGNEPPMQWVCLPEDPAHSPHNTPADAVYWGHWSRKKQENWTDKCAAWVGSMYGGGSGVTNAYEWWDRTPPEYRVARGERKEFGALAGPAGRSYPGGVIDLSGEQKDWIIPAGAILHWSPKVGNGAGHVALMAQNGVLSSYTKGIKTVGLTSSIAEYHRTWTEGDEAFRGVSVPWFNSPGAKEQVYVYKGINEDDFEWTRKSSAHVIILAVNVNLPWTPPDAGEGAESADSSTSDSSDGGYDFGIDDFTTVKRTDYKDLKFNPPIPSVFRRSFSASKPASTYPLPGPKPGWIDASYDDKDAFTGYTWTKPGSDGTWMTGTIVRDYSFISGMDLPDSTDPSKTEYIGPEDNGKHGFRFLFNPARFTEEYRRPDDGDPYTLARDAAAGNIFYRTSAGMGLSLFLSRVDDLSLLASKDWKSYYPSNSITDEDREMIVRRGTMWDIEHLFRVCNGSPRDLWSGKSADIGMLLPTLVQIWIGPRLIRGVIDSINFEHQIFAPGMIPTITQLNLSISRIIDAGNGVDLESNTSTSTEDPA